MAGGGKGKTGGKAGQKEAAAKSQKSHSAKAGLQVSVYTCGCFIFGLLRLCRVRGTSGFSASQQRSESNSGPEQSPTLASVIATSNQRSSLPP